MALPSSYSRVTLANRPKVLIESDTFAVDTQRLEDLKPSYTHVVVRADYISLDPAMRVWLNEQESYVPPVQIGETMRAYGCGTVGKVQEGKVGGLKVGDTVKGRLGWTEYELLKESELENLR